MIDMIRMTRPATRNIMRDSAVFGLMSVSVKYIKIE